MLFLRRVEPRRSDQYLDARPCALGLVSPPPQTQTLGSELPSARGQAGRSVADGQQVCPDVEASRAMTGQPRPRSRHGEPRACVHVCVSMSASCAQPGSPAILGPTTAHQGPRLRAALPQTPGQGLSLGTADFRGGLPSGVGPGLCGVLSSIPGDIQAARAPGGTETLRRERSAPRPRARLRLPFVKC